MDKEIRGNSYVIKSVYKNLSEKNEHDSSYEDRIFFQKRFINKITDEDLQREISDYCSLNKNETEKKLASAIVKLIDKTNLSKELSNKNSDFKPTKIKI